MKIIRIALSLFALTIGSLSAHAADNSSFSWDGGYAGLNMGISVDRLKSAFSVTDVATDLSASRSHKGDDVKFLGGVQVGYNFAFDKVIAGIETDFQYAEIKNHAKETYVTDFGEGGYHVTNKVDWFGTLRARLGYAPAESVLLYATGGLAYGQVKTGYSYESVVGDDVIDVSGSRSKTKLGYTLGSGAEYALSSNWTLKGEYLWTDLGKTKISYADADVTGIDADLVTKARFSTIRAGINYKF
jgi:outer membrane immunogenic protein